MSAKDLIRGRESTVFVSLILLGSVCLLAGSQKLPEGAATRAVLVELAAIGIAAFVATIFFGFKDVQEVIARSLSVLLLEGDIVSHLSESKRKQLQRRLLLGGMGGAVQVMPESLFEFTDGLQRHVLESPHVINYSTTITLEDIPDRPGFLRHHMAVTYTISCRHLRDGRGLFPLIVRHEMTDLAGVSDAQMLKAFRVTVGKTNFTSADATVSKRTNAGTTFTLITFEKTVEVVGESHVTLERECVSSHGDPTEILYAWFPTKGFRVTLLYRGDMTYDVAWLASLCKGMTDFPFRTNVQQLPTGVIGEVDDWLMPGNGVILYWFPKKPGALPVQAARTND